MKYLALTQRVDVIADYDERRDCLDQAWGRMLSAIGFAIVPLPNCADLENYMMDLRGVILTGGNDIGGLPGARGVAPERDRMESALLDIAIEKKLPVLGVCRGMQKINLHLGGTVMPIDGHVAVPHDVEGPDGTRTVNSFHAYAIPADGLADGLNTVAKCADGTVECYRHDTLPIAGIMWHPERDQDLHPNDAQLFSDLFGGVSNP